MIKSIRFLILMLMVSAVAQAQDYRFSRELSVGTAPKSLHIEGDKLYTVFNGGNKIVVSNLQGDILENIPVSIQPSDVAVDIHGNLLVTSKEAKKLIQINAAGEELKSVVFPKGANGVTVHENGDIYVSTLLSIEILDDQLNKKDAITSLSADKFREIRNVTFDASNTLYIVDKNTGALKISSFANGKAQVEYMIKKGNGSANYNMLASIVTNKAGDVLLSSEAPKSGCLQGVYRFSNDGVRKGEVGPLGNNATPEGFVQPYGLAIDANDNLYIADVKANTIKVYEAVDLSAPVLENLAVTSPKRGIIELSFVSNETGLFHYIVQDASLTAPTVDALKAAPTKEIVEAGAISKYELQVSSNVAQKVYLLSVDASQNYSGILVSEEIVLESDLAMHRHYVSSKQGESVSITFSSNDEAQLYWALTAIDAPALTVEQIIAGEGALQSGNTAALAILDNQLTIAGLTAERYMLSSVLVKADEQSAIKQMAVAPYSEVDRVFARYQDLLLGESLDYSDPTVFARYTALKQTIVTAHQQLPKYQWEEGLPPYDMVKGTEPRVIVSSVLLPLAMSYHLAGPASEPNEDYQNPVLAQQIVDLYDYLAKRGLVSGSDFSFGSGGSFLGMCGYYYSSILMRDLLVSQNAWEPVASMMLWISREVNPENDKWGAHVEHNGSRSDGVRTLYQYRLMALVAQTDSMLNREAEMDYLVQALNQNMKIAPAWDGFIKPDFTGYHHHGPWGNAYNTDALHTSAQMALMLKDTPYALAPESTYNLAQGMLAFRSYCAKYDISRGMCGRFPNQLTGLTDNIPAFAYLYHILEGDLQQEIGAAFNRLYDTSYSGVMEKCVQDVRSNIFFHGGMGMLQTMNEVKGLVASLDDTAVEQMNAVYPYSGMQVHRRDDWAAIVKSYTKYVWDFETNEEQNWFGRNQSAGALSIYASPDAEGVVTAQASGVGYNGWDWSHVPGTTTFHISLDSMLRDVQTYTMAKFSPSALAGGVSLSGGHGVYGMRYNDIRQAYNYGEEKWQTYWRGVTLSANKSWFFFDDYIVALGSDINNTHEHYEAHTTIFQNELTNVNTPIYVNGESVTGLAYEYNQQSQESLVMTDAVGNAYYFPNGENIHIHRSEQESRQDRNYNNRTTGEYATAWINHGNTVGGDYHYAIHVRGAEQAKSGSQAAVLPYVVEQQNNQAHIVACESKQMRGYAIYQKGEFANDKLLTAVDKPCMIMTQELTEGEMKLSLSNPELGFYPEDRFPYQVWSIDSARVFMDSEVQPVELSLKGMWNITTAHPAVSQLDYNAEKDVTTLLFSAKDAISCEVVLKNTCTGIEDLETEDTVQISPNPCRDFVRLKFENSDTRTINIYSVTGSLVSQQQSFDSEILISTNSLASGTYFLQVNGVNQGKLIKL